MQTIDSQIQALTGTANDTEMNDWATEGAKEVMNALPDSILSPYSQTSNINDGNGLTSMRSKRLFYVLREETDSGPYVNCREVTPGEYNMASDSDSIYYRAARTPIYSVIGDTLNVLPTPTAGQTATVYYLAYPDIDVSNDSAIANFPDNANSLVVLYAACKVLHNKMNEKASSLPSDLAVPVLGTVSTSLPSYTAPTAFVMPVAPAGVDIDFSEVGTIESFIIPVFSSSIVETNLTNPTFTPPVMDAPDWSDTNTWIATEEDSEMLASRVQEISGKISEYSAKMGEAQGKFSKENAILQKDLQISLQNYQGELQKYSNDIQKESARVSASVNDYQAKVTKALQTYQAETGFDLSKYQAEIQVQTQKYQNDLQQNTASFTNDLQKYSAEVQKVSTDNQSVLSRFGQELADYNAKMQKESVDYQWLQGQYAQLKQDYNQGLQILIGGGNSPQQGGQ